MGNEPFSSATSSTVSMTGPFKILSQFRSQFAISTHTVVTDQNLHDLFSCCGDIEYARTMQCDKGCNGIGYVCFKKAESISMALELNNADLLDRPVRVQRYVKKTAGGPNEKKNKKEKPTGAIRRLGKKSQPKGKTFKGKDGKESNAKKQFTGMKAKEKKKKVRTPGLTLSFRDKYLDLSIRIPSLALFEVTAKPKLLH